MKKLTQGNRFICPKWYSSRILGSTVRIFPFSKQPALDLVRFSCMNDLSSASAHKANKNFLSLGKNCLLLGNYTQCLHHHPNSNLCIPTGIFHNRNVLSTEHRKPLDSLHLLKTLKAYRTALAHLSAYSLQIEKAEWLYSGIQS